MKRTLLFGIMLGLLLTAARPARPVQLTVINKTGKPMAIRLDEINPDKDQQALFYYLSVPRGDGAQPAEKTFTILRERYAMQVYYIETYDPVYGWSCRNPGISHLEANRNTRLVFLQCDKLPANAGEPGMRKFGATNKPGRR